jgi:nitrogen fixation NifU-like protein
MSRHGRSDPISRDARTDAVTAPQAPVALDLYQQIVLEHSRSPRNFRRLGAPDRRAEGHNRLCGDKVTLYVRLAGGTLAEVTFEAAGCAICLASASLLTETAAGRPVGEAERLAAGVIGHFEDPAAWPLPPALAALDGVRLYPSRIRCATLPWQTLRQALAGPADAIASTEPAE